MAQQSVLRFLPEKMAVRRCLPALTGLIILLAVILIVQAPFLTAERLYYHDSLNALTAIGLFYDRVVSGSNWLWSAELNAGHPLWMIIESAPFLDPVAMSVYLVSSILKTNWFLPYQVTCFLWLLLFSLGGAMCAQYLTRSPWSGVLTFLLLLGGPLAIMSPAQSWGFLVPFRYLPWLVWAYLHLRTNVTTPHVLALSAISTISLAGYQSAYLLFVMMFLLIADALVHRGDYFRWLGQLLRFRYLVWATLPALAALPTLAYLKYSSYLVIIPRVYIPKLVYIFEWSQFFGDLFFAWSGLFSGGYVMTAWHGTTYFGFLAPILIVHGIQRAARNRFRAELPLGGCKVSATLVVWLIMTTILVCGSLGISEYVSARGSLFGVRNYGFLLTGSLFLLALLTAQGFSEILKNGCALSDLALNTTIFVIFAAIYFWQIGPQNASPASLAIPIAIFASIIIGLYLLRRLAPSRSVFAVTVILLMTFETLFFTDYAMPSLGTFIAKRQITWDVGQALERSPRLAKNSEKFQLYRSLDFPISESWPLVLAAPAINKRPAALLPPINSYDLGVGIVSHYFRIRAYEQLVTNHSDSAAIEAVLGVTRPVLELVPQSAFAIDDTGGLTLILQGDLRRDELREPSSLTGKVRVSEFTGDRVVTEIVSPVQAVLVYRDNMAPGWSVTLNGEDAELLVVDGVNKAVAVSPGRHLVEFVYRPWPYLIAFALRALAMLAAVTVCIGIVVSGHHKPGQKRDGDRRPEVVR